MFLKSNLILKRNKRTLAETVLEIEFKSTMHLLFTQWQCSEKTLLPPFPSSRCVVFLFSRAQESNF